MVTASASRLRTMRRTEANITMTLSESIAHLYTGKHQYQRKYTGMTIPQPEGIFTWGCPGHSRALAIFAAAVAAAFAAKWIIQSPITSCSGRDHSVCKASANWNPENSERRRCGLSAGKGAMALYSAGEV